MTANHFAAMLVMSLLVTLSVQAEENWKPVAVPNVSFEDGENVPKGWTALQGNMRTPSAESIMSWDREFARTGKRSLYIRRGAGGPLRWSVREPVNVTPGKQYQLRVWYRSNPENAGSLNLSVSSRRELPDTQKLWETGRKIEFQADTQGQWQQATFDFTPPVGADQIWIRLGDQNAFPPRSGPPVELWFDDISLWQQP